LQALALLSLLLSHLLGPFQRFRTNSPRWKDSSALRNAPLEKTLAQWRHHVERHTRCASRFAVYSYLSTRHRIFVV